ncbi:MAG: M23 family metallopeptidase [Clostridia bacterium]
MDILANRRTQILSATDGVVQYIGYMAIPGNYVVVSDPYGYEYHYYHMFEQSKFVKPGDIVKQGDAIGLVGNTGNSAANHLHLTIITPEHAYVNPYDLYVQAGIGPIKPDTR